MAEVERSREERHRHRIEVGCRGAYGDEGVHVGAPVAEGLVSADVELVACDELDRGRQQEQDDVLPLGDAKGGAQA